MRLRIDELAREAGMTSRTIRAHQARGLLPPPELDGRTGYYGEEHLRRLELIEHLQERGFSLEAIRQTLDAWSRGGDLAQLVGIRNLLAAPITDEEPAELTLEQLLDRFPEAAESPDLLARAVGAGLLEHLADDRYRAPSPLLIDAGAELARLGVPLGDILGLVEAIRPDIADIAQRFVSLVSEHLTRPILEGRTEADAARDALASVGRLKPLAIEVIRPFLARELQAAIDAEVRRHAEELPAPEQAS
jgi:DNA-binding transcriptional MerR regulator